MNFEEYLQHDSGNRHPDIRYRGYKGEVIHNNATDDEKAAYQVGVYASNKETIESKLKIILEKAHQVIDNNRETFVAQWVIQNPDKNISDYELVYKTNWDGCTVSIERK